MKEEYLAARPNFQSNIWTFIIYQWTHCMVHHHFHYYFIYICNKQCACVPIVYTIVQVHRKLRRISRLHRRQLRCQAGASAFIPRVIGFSTSSPSVVGLRLPFSLFVIVCLECDCGSWRWSTQTMYSREFCFTAGWGRASYRSPAVWQKKRTQRLKLAYASLSTVTKKQGWSRIRQEAGKPPNSP